MMGGTGKMRVASCETASGYFAIWSASETCEYLGKVRDEWMCESPTERLKIYSSNQLLLEPISRLISGVEPTPAVEVGLLKNLSFR